jgi:glycosyltransferase involved in cell wall biosynthesis
MPVAVVVANLIHYKGHEDLIKGLGQAARQISSPWKVILAGRDHGLRPGLERLARNLQIAGNVEFIDQCSDVPRLLAAADLGLLTSHEEGFSNVVLESMAAALPMIVTDVGGNPEAVISEKTGLVIPPHNPSAICDAFLRLLRAPELRRCYGIAARERVAQEFSLDRCVNAHAELYEELLWRVRHGWGAKSATLGTPAVVKHLDKKKAILVTHVITGLGIGGSERSLLTLANRLDPKQFKTEIVTLLEQSDSSYDDAHRLGLRVISLGMRPGLPTIRAAKKLMCHFRQAKPSIVQTWLYHADLIGLLSGWAAGAPHVVWNLRCSDVTQGSRFIQWGLRGMGVLSRFPDAVVVNSHQGRLTHEGWNYRPRRWVEIGNCVDSDRFRPRPNESQALRRKLGFSLNTTIVGCVARFHPMKDHQNFLEAARLLSRRCDNIQFVLCGKGCDNENACLLEIINALGIANKVYLLGNRLDIEDIYPTFDIAVSASAFGEGSSNTLLEAMACGIPSVVTNVGDSAAILGPAGFVVRPRDPEALARACEAVSTGNRALWGSMGRERAVKEYGIEMTVRQYEALYSELAT